MATRTTAEIDFSTFPDSDGEPMAETMANRIQMVDLIWAVGLLFVRQGRERAIVSSSYSQQGDEQAAPTPTHG